MGSVPGQVNKILRVVQCSQKKKKTQKNPSVFLLYEDSYYYQLVIREMIKEIHLEHLTGEDGPVVYNVADGVPTNISESPQSHKKHKKANTHSISHAGRKHLKCL